MKRALLVAMLTMLPLIGLAQEEASGWDQMPPPPAVPVGDPGYYGQVDVINTAPPVVYATALIVQVPPPGVIYSPVYLRVPTYYYQNWPQYCGFYNACFYPVFFVQEVWYANVYAPWYRHYYPYGRPGFVAHVRYGGHVQGAYPRGGSHFDHGGWHHDDHRR